MAGCTGRQHIVQFANIHHEFKLPELVAVSAFVNAGLTYNVADYAVEYPFLIVKFANPSAIPAILERTILVKSIYELWGHGDTMEELHAALRAYPAEWLMPHVKSQTPFKYLVETYGKKSTLKRNISLIEGFSYMAFEGPIDLQQPQRTYVLLEYFGDDPSEIPELPLHLYFGMFVGQSRRGDTLDKYDLKKRRFIATTSMDAELSFIMANMAMARPGTFIFDPFVGTGSLLVPCAVRGAMVLGSDINPIVLRGKGIGTTEVWMRDNFVQYGILDKFVGILASDNSHIPWRLEEFFHAIVADPPYGIREGARKIGVKEGRELKKIPDHLRANHIPQSKPYELADVLGDLLDFSAKFLQMGGRLVYWMPCFRPDYDDSHVPQHPSLRLVSNCEQKLSGFVLSRRLITMEKIAPYQAHSLANDTVLFTALSNLRNKVMACHEEERPEAYNKRKERRSEATVRWKGDNPEEYERQMEYRRNVSAVGIAKRIEREHMRARGELVGRGTAKELCARSASSAASSAPPSRGGGTPCEQLQQDAAADAHTA